MPRRPFVAVTIAGLVSFANTGGAQMAGARRDSTAGMYAADMSLPSAERDMQEIATRVDFVLEVVDIRDHADTWERYRHAVPVVTVDGEEIARLRVDKVALESRLRGTSVA